MQPDHNSECCPFKTAAITSFFLHGKSFSIFFCQRHHAALSPLMPLTHTRGDWPLVAFHKKVPDSCKGARGFSHRACSRAALPSERAHRHTRMLRRKVCREFPMAVHPFSSPFPNNGALPLLWPGPFPGFPLLWHSTPQPVAHRSPTHGALLLSPLGCPHTTSPCPLPRTDIRSLSLITKPLPKHLRLWCPGWWFR